VRRGAQTLKIKFDLGETQTPTYRVEEIPDASPAQRQLRDDWLAGKAEK